MPNPRALTIESPLGRVRIVVEPPAEGSEPSVADFIAARLRIRITPGFAPDHSRRCLLHEILHLALEASGGTWTEEEEERIVSALESPLFDVLTRNGWLRLPALGARR